MPLHSWLPRAHPLAPANVSALMSGVMIKLALYGLIRVLFEWAAPVPAVGRPDAARAGRALGGRRRRCTRCSSTSSSGCWRSIRSRTSGSSSSALGASLVFASIGRWQWSAIAFAAALLHTLNHAVFKALLFLGAGSFCARRRRARARPARRAAAADAVDRRRVRGRRDGDRRPAAAERVRVGVDDAPVAAARRRRTGRSASRSPARSRPPRWPRPPRSRCFCFVKVIGLVLLGAPRRAETAQARETPVGMRGPLVFLAGLCVAARASFPGCWSRRSRGSARARPRSRAARASPLPGTGGLPTLALAVGLVAAGRRPVAGRARAAAPRRRPAWACGQLVEPALAWTSAGFTKPLRLFLEAVLRPQPRADGRASSAACCRRSPTRRRCRTSSTR